MRRVALSRDVCALMTVAMLLALPGGVQQSCAGTAEGPSGGHPSFHHQPLPGDLNLTNLSKESIWRAPACNVTTQLLVGDLDGDGRKELVFGTDQGRVTAMDVGRRSRLWEARPTHAALHDMAVGDVDLDGQSELVVSSSDGLYCLDASDGDTEWRDELDMDSSEVFLVPRTTGGGETRYDILLMWMDGDFYYGRWAGLSRFDGKGKQLFRTTLSEVGETGPYASCILADLDSDGKTEVVVSDRGFSYMGFGGTGHQLWVVDATSGEVLDSLALDDRYFTSPPMLLPYSGRTCVAVGLMEGTGNRSEDLLVYDFPNGTHELLDLSRTDDNAHWTQLCYCPSTGVLVMCTDSMDLLAWSMEQGREAWNWTHTGTPLVGTPLSLCDVDGDGTVELLVPAGGVHIMDLLNGTFKAQVTQKQGRAWAIRLAVEDLDGDGRSEMLFGYYDDFDIQAYEVFLIGDVGRSVGDDGPSTDGDGAGGLVVPIVLLSVLLAILVLGSRRR